MLKRFILLLTALSLFICPAAMAEESLKDFPLMASRIPVKLSDVLPLNANDVNDFGVGELMDGLFSVTAMETDAEAVYLVLETSPTVSGSLSVTMSLQIDGYAADSVEGIAAQSPSGQSAMRFAVRNAPSVAVGGFHVTLANEAGVASVVYDASLIPTEKVLSIDAADISFTFTLDGAGHLRRYTRQDEADIGFDATYEETGELASALITTASPQRVYAFEGAALSSITEDRYRIIADYNASTGMLKRYTLSTPAENGPGVQRTTFSPYGDIIEIAYPRQTEDWDITYVVWSPNFGWHPADQESADGVFEIDASDLPDPASLVPPLPVAEKPAYRTDILSIADLPQLPRHIAELPEVLDLQVADGVATVTLNRSLTLPNAIPAFRNRWKPSDDVILASSTQTAGVYVAEVEEGIAAEDLCFVIFLPASDLNQFSYGYAYDPLTASWQVTLLSPAAEFVVDCSPAGKPVTAELIDLLVDENNRAALTFDEETGALSSYEYYIELPFAHRGSWYTFTYIPGKGITTAVCGDRSTGRFLWTQEDGWTDLVLDTSPEGLFDPLNFPFPLPFPTA